MRLIVIMLSCAVIAFPLNAQLAWKRLPFSLDYPRIDFQAHALNDHEIIVIGGHTGKGQISITTSDSVLKSCEILDIK